MPVYKYRTLDAWQESKASLWLDCEDPRLAQRIQSHWARWSALVPIGAPRGVFKYRSMEEASAARERWEQERVDRIRAERLRKSSSADGL